MTRPVPTMSPAELTSAVPDERDAPTVGLLTAEGALPLTGLSVDAHVHGLAVHLHVHQVFTNRLDRAIEATYIHPLPDRAAVTALRMTVADRVIDGVLKERGAARQEYDAAIAQGHRAAIAEENRPDVFSMRVGNIQPGETVTADLDLVGRLPVDDGVATLRYPLVVAPRYVPGTVLTGRNAGDGVADDTDAVPDASTVSPPVLLPGAPNPVRLAIRVTIDPAGLHVRDLRSSLHDVVVVEPQSGDAGPLGVELRPGERVDRDFVLRFAITGDDVAAGVTCVPDTGADSGTWMATVVPGEPTTPAPRDVVLVLDRSGSMQGWKMVAARRAAARIVDSLRTGDRFAVVAFDDVVEAPPERDGLISATDRNRFAAVEFLARLDARGGTQMLPALQHALRLLPKGEDRAASLVLVTDGQIANEDHVLSGIAAGLGGVRVFTVGVDRAVNAGFLRRLAAAGGGHCDLVESEDRLDEAMAQLHRRIAAPVLVDVTARVDGVEMIADTTTPARADCFAGVPLVIAGRYTGRPGATAVIAGTDDRGRPWSSDTACHVASDTALAAVWARAHLRDLEDRYAVTGGGDLADRIVATSLEFGVLSRFTAFVAVDRSQTTASTEPVTVVQPVEQPSGWDPRFEAELGGPVMMPTMARAAAPPLTRPATAAEAGAPAAPGSPLGAGRWRVSRAAFDRDIARRDALVTEVAEALAARDVRRARRLLRHLRTLRDDFASSGATDAMLDDLRALIDALATWVEAPAPAAADAVAAALDPLLPDHTAAPSRERFWR